MVKLSPSTSTARNPRTWKRTADDADPDPPDDLDALGYHELRSLAADIEGINGRASEETLRTELAAHFEE